MMLSILIPVYNFDIRTLIRQLAHQCAVSHLRYEIICLDDASSSAYQEYYQQIKKELKIQWLTTTKNIGRSAARNTLARQANYEHILFLDCDVLLPDDEFINRYLEFIQQKNKKVIYGSCKYAMERPSDKQFVLHWTYGNEIENPPLKDRIKNPYQSFHTVNFLVKRDIILSYPFDESISKYGYEDSLWAKTLQLKNIDIYHIDNPVLHIGLYSVKYFLRKTAQSIHNLIYLHQTNKLPDTSLLRFIKKIQTFSMESIAFSMYKWNERRIVKNLLSDHPSLVYLSIYKMGLFFRFSKKVSG